MAIDESFSYVHEHLPKGYGYACQLMVRPYKTDSLAPFLRFLRKLTRTYLYFFRAKHTTPLILE